jgi:helicase SWR1
VRSRNKALIKAEQDRLGKLQLNAMLDKSTTMLQAQKVEMAADSSSEEDEDSEEDSQREGSEEEEEEEGEVEEEVATPEPITNVRRQRLVRTTSARDSSSSSTPIDLEEPADDDVVFEAPEDDARAGEDQAMEDEMEAEEDDDDDSELGGLADDADIPIEELMRRNGYGAVLAQVDDEDTAMDTTAEVPSSSASAVEEAPPTVEEVEAEAMSEFGSGSDDDRDGEDDQFDEDMDGNDDGAVSDDSEMDGLAEDADLPIEELMRKYGRAPETNGIHINGDDPSSVAEDIEEEEAEEEEEVEEEAEEEVEEMEETAVAVPERVNLRPPFLLRGSLRPYQQAGLEWLAGLYSTGVNGFVSSSIPQILLLTPFPSSILADEMGLGKTIQTISLLAHLACDKGQWGPHLVVVPTSVMLNWEMEFKKFLPGFKILTYYGSQKERKEKRRGWNTENAFHVCVTSYQLVLADQHMFRRKPWHYMILDEAHHIKNFRSQRWQTLLGFNARHRLLLTGTPLQNNLMELVRPSLSLPPLTLTDAARCLQWSLLYFLMPHGLTSDGKGPFADHSDFQAWFSNPMERAIENGEAMDDETKATVAKLHTVLRPYLLRRLKAEVETQMPGKTESIIYCRLSKRQRFLYDDFMSRSQTRETLGSGHFLSIINCLMQLRKVCNHPDLFEVRPIVTSFAMARSVATEYEPAELLVRKRLLDNEPVSKMDWSSLTLLKPDSETSASSIAASRRVLWDAAAQLPSLQDFPLGMDLDVEPAHDTKTIAGWKQYNTWSQARQTKDRLDRMALTNTRRCANAVPFFGHELLHTLSTPSRQHALLPVDVARDPRTSFESSTILPTLVKSFVSRAEQGDELVARFGCVTPKVKAADMPRHALSGLSLAQAEAIEVEASIEILHRASTKLSVAFPDRSLLQYDCGKLQKLDELLRECKAGGHRVLIFTQMTKVLDILEIFLSFHGHRYLRLDGSTKIEQRQIITERFNSNDRILCFISSTRSGGLGINLQVSPIHWCPSSKYSRLTGDSRVPILSSSTTAIGTPHWIVSARIGASLLTLTLHHH